MKLVIDMNLSPDWVSSFAEAQIESVHWSKIGDPRAEDTEIMDWARNNFCIVFTHDLDFGTILALTKAESPSVVQVRTQNISPDYLGNTMIALLRKYEYELEKGALIVLDEGKSRVRILPLRKS